VPAGSPVTEISSRPRTATPAVLDAMLPLCAALVAVAFAGLLLRSLRRRPSREKVLWAAGFVLFAVAAASEAVAQRMGWTPCPGAPAMGSLAASSWRLWFAGNDSIAEAAESCDTDLEGYVTTEGLA
jgi:hypothetical protein